MFSLLLITAWPLLLISPGRPPELREAIEGHVSVVVNLAFAAYTRTSNLSLLRSEYEYCKLFAMAARIMARIMAHMALALARAMARVLFLLHLPPGLPPPLSLLCCATNNMRCARSRRHTNIT